MCKDLNPTSNRAERGGCVLTDSLEERTDSPGVLTDSLGVKTNSFGRYEWHARTKKL